MATAIRLDLGCLQKQVSNAESTNLLERVVGETDGLLEHIHEIASRARPSVLDDLGLKDALESLFSEYEERTSVAVKSHFLFDQEEIPTKIGENSYRIIAEALSNVSKYANVDEVEVRIEYVEGILHLTIEDAGTGFRLEDLEASTRLGILGMRERAELLGGTFTLNSNPGKGTHLFVQLPIYKEPDVLGESLEQ